MVETTVHHTVHWGETDMAGIVFYPNYFHWFDIGSHHLFNAIGLPPRELMNESKIAFPILDVACSFRKPLYYQDEIKVVTRVSEVSDKTFRMEHDVYRGEELTGKGHELRGWVLFEDGKIKAQMIPMEAKMKLSNQSWRDEDV